MSVHRDYLEKRERECREAAERALDAGVARVHRDFASHYARALEADAGGSPLSFTVSPAVQADRRTAERDRPSFQRARTYHGSIDGLNHLDG